MSESENALQGRGRPRTGLPMGLPSLYGWRLSLFRIVWVVVFALALAAPIGGVYVVYSQSDDTPFSRTGISWRSDGKRITLNHSLSDEARRAGLGRGYLILAVDGSPVPHHLRSVPILRERLAGPVGSNVTLRIRSPQGMVRDVRLTRSDEYLRQTFAGTGLTPRLARIITLTFGLLPALFLIPAAVLLFLRRPRDSVAALLSISLLMIATTTASAATFIVEVLGAPLLLRLGQIGWYGVVLVLLAFPDGRFGSRPIGALVIAILAWAPFTILRITPSGWFNYSLMVILSICALILSARYRAMPAGSAREQVRWALFGFVIGALLLILATILRQTAGMLGGPDTRWWIWTEFAARLALALALISFGLGLLVSILRYRLYDAEAVISRSAAYAVLTALMAATFGAVTKGLELAFEGYFGRDAGVLPSIIGAGFAVALITPLNHRIQNWAERRFQKALAHLRRDLPECVGDLRETASVGALVDELLVRVAVGVRASHAALIVGDRVAGTRDVDPPSVEAWLAANPLDAATEALDCAREDTLFPVRLALRVRHGESEPVGWLLLGPRPDGSFYGRDEREALAEIADPIARAVRIVLLREEQTAALAARFEAIERKLERALKAPGRRQTRGKLATGS